MAYNQLYFYASLFIYLAAVFDFLTAWRTPAACIITDRQRTGLTGRRRQFRFGPGTILYSWLKGIVGSDLSNPLPYFAFIISAFSALRLAKFNLDTRQTCSFIGLPTPAMAILTASLIALFDAGHICGTYNMEWLRPAASNQWVVLAYVLILSVLMVSELPMFSLKFKNLKWAGNEPKFILLGAAIVLLVIFHLAAIPLIMLLFILMSVVLFALGKSTNKPVGEQPAIMRLRKQCFYPAVGILKRCVPTQKKPLSPNIAQTFKIVQNFVNLRKHNTIKK